MPKDTKIAVLGDGGWGTTLSLLLSQKGYNVYLWGAFPEYLREVKKTRENRKFLPGFHLNERIFLEGDIKKVIDHSFLVILAVPSQYLRGVLKKCKKENLKGKLFLSVAKGIEKKTLLTMSQVVRNELGGVSLAVLSGPTIAREVALKMPAAAVIASTQHWVASEIRNVMMTDYFGIYESHDSLGVELGGSLKNVIAIAAGIVDGLGFGSNTKAALSARGLAEMARLGKIMGAKRETFMGLSGLGDLVTTALSPHSRNRWFGEEIGKGRTMVDIQKQTEMVVEGVETTQSAYELARKYQVDMPITEAVYGILFKSKDPRVALTALMRKEPRLEVE